MKKINALSFAVLAVFLHTSLALAALYDWGTTGVADTSMVREIVQLTNNSFDNRVGSPSYFFTCPWSPDGSWVVYQVSDPVTGADICKIHADSGNSSCLTSGFFSPSDYVNNPSFGADNRIYFAKNSLSGNEIWRMNSDGSNKENLTLKHGGLDGKYVKVSPNGEWIAFIHGDGIWVSKSDGTALSSSAVSGSVQIYQPQFSWSPDSQWIAYQGAEGGQRWIYKVRKDGTENQVLTKPDMAVDPQLHFHPSWSPDGRKIAYLWSSDGVFDHTDSIMVVNESGELVQAHLDSVNRPLAELVPSINAPLSWSPDSRYLAYQVSGSSDKALHIINVETPTDKIQLTTGYADNTPIWSPAGDRILFSDAGLS